MVSLSESFTYLRFPAGGNTDSEMYISDGCHEAFEYSPGLFYHIVKDEKCGYVLPCPPFAFAVSLGGIGGFAGG